jgi:hypothetical protein
MKRRDFVKAAGVLLGTIGGGGLLTAAPKSFPSPKGESLEPFDVEIGVEKKPTNYYDPCRVIIDYDWSEHFEGYLNSDSWSLPPEGKFEESRLYSSFIIKDGEASKSFADLLVIHFNPAMQSMARVFNNGEVFPYEHKFSLLTPQMGVIQSASYGGRVPMRCTMSYDIDSAGVLVQLEASCMELFKPKTSITRDAPTVIGYYGEGYTEMVTTTASDWEIGDMLQFHDDEYYTVIEVPVKNKLLLDRPLETAVDHATPAVYAGQVPKYFGWGIDVQNKYCGWDV